MTSKEALTPSMKLLSAIGSALVHFDEFHSPDGRPVDLTEAQERLKDPDVQAWIKAMGPMLPLKRVK